MTAPTGQRGREAPAPALPESNRVEAFSDGVLAIAITLLVLGLHSDFERGRFAHGLGEQWPAYAAYAAAFLTIASLWINHHDLFNRVARVDARLNCLNPALLLVASSVPFPAAVLGSAVGLGDRHDQIAACLLYAGHRVRDTGRLYRHVQPPEPPPRPAH